MKAKHIKRIVFYIGLYISVGVFLYYAQNAFIYFPTPPVAHTYKTITIENEGQTIIAIVIHPENATDNALIYFGGNAEAVAYSAPDFENHFKNRTVFLLNYRGYGTSTGKPSEKANYADATKLFNRVHKKYKHVAVMGRSLGSGVATYIAATQNISHLILATPYDSIQSLAQAKIILYPMSLILNQKYLSAQRAPHISAKILALIAEKDTVIPPIHSKRLTDAFNADQITIRNLKDTTHNTISDTPEYFDAIEAFLK